MFVNPEQIIKTVNVPRGAQVADFGSGAGFYVIPLAKAVGPQGKVYALDVQPEMLELTRAKAREARLLNVIMIRADLETPRGSNLAMNTMDFVFISNTLFQTENKLELLKEAFRVLKNGGEAVVIDWNTSFATAGGPPPDKMVSMESAEKLLTEAGFKRVREFPAEDNHYGLLYQKP